MAIILNYKAAEYQSKISELQGYNSQLDGCRGELETLRDQVQSFWTGNDSAEYMNAITKAISRVMQASDNVKGLTMEYQQTVDKYSRQSQALDTLVSDVGTAIDKAIDVGKVVTPLL